MARAKENGQTAGDQSAADAAAALLAPLVTAPEVPGGASYDPTVFDRLSVERRVLGYITDDVDKTALGPRNTLAALTYALMNDPYTTDPPAGHGRLEVEGRSVTEIAQTVLDLLTALVDAGLAEQRDDGSYAVTDAGHAELRAG